MEKNLEELLENQIDESKKKKINVYPVHVNRASQIGHPCMRYLVFDRTRWQDKQKHSIGLQYIFDEGNEQEKLVVKTLMDAGFDIMEQQRSFSEKKENISGHIDLVLSHPEIMPDPVPGEIKSMSPFNFASVNSYSDIINHKHYYMRNYAAQMQMYLYLTEHENGLFIFKNKTSGKLKFIFAPIDYDYIDSLFKKAEKINAYAKEESPKYSEIDATDDISICEGCGYSHVCFKDKDFGQGTQIYDDDEIKEKIEQMKSLEESYRNYSELKKQIGDCFNAQVKEQQGTKFEFMIGDYVVGVSKYKQKRAVVPEDIKLKYMEESEIIKLGKIVKI